MPEPEYKRCLQCGRPFTCPPRRSAAQWASMRFHSRACATRWQSTTHGATTHLTKSPEYQSWIAMKSRCLNPNANAYDQYGGRGITTCERWRYDFPAFLADMGTRPAGTTLDRIDPDGDYEPANTRWATAKEQVNNRRLPLRTCLVEGCDRKHLAIGRCSMHYQRERKARAEQQGATQ